MAVPATTGHSVKKDACTPTELAAQKLRQAQEERSRGGRYGAELAECFARSFEEAAGELLTLPTAPAVGPGGEVIRPQPLPDGCRVSVPTHKEAMRFVVRDTLRKGATRVAEDASVRRTDLLMQPSFNALAMGVDAAETIGAANSLEKMLAHQMAVAHEAAMRMTDRGLSYEHSKSGDQVEACRCLNTAARLMGAFQNAALTIQRLRNGGSQTVTVQHVNLAPGSQAVIGNVQAGGSRRRRSNQKDG